MFRVGRNEDVAAHIDTSTRALLERDDGQTIEEVIQDLFAFRGRLLRDAIANLRRGIEHAAVVADLSQAAKAADGRRRAKSQQVAVIDLGGEPRCPNRGRVRRTCRSRAKTRPGKRRGGR